jgi:two-component system NarL family sensor kinase
MKYVIESLLVLCCFVKANAQSAWHIKRDSVLILLSTSKQDTTRFNQLLYVGRVYLKNNQDSAIYYFEQALKLSTQLHYEAGIADAYTLSCVAYADKGSMDTAILLGNKGLEAAKKSGRPQTLSAAYTNLASPFTKKGDFKKAIEYYLEAEKLSASVNDSGRLSDIYATLNYGYNNLKDYNKAYEYGIKSVQLARAQKRKNTEVISLINLGGSLIYLQKFDTALVVYHAADEVANEVNDKVNSAIVQSGFVYIYERMGKYEMIKPYVDKEIALAREANNHEGMVLGLLGMGDYYFYKKDYTNANIYARMSLDSILHYGYTTYLKNNYLFLSQIAIGLGNLKDFEHFSNLKDSVEEAQQSAEILQTTKDLEAKYQTEKKEQQLKLQLSEIKQERKWKYILAALLLLLVFIAFLARRGYKNRQRLLLKEKQLQQQHIIQLENEKQLTATQAVLRGQEEERSRLAKDLHDGLGGILSSAKYSFNNMKQNFILTEENAAAFEKSMNMLDASISELRRVAHNMMPETLMKLSLNEALQDYCLQVTQSGALPVTYQSFGVEDAEVDNTAKTTVYRIVQELINNIVKHAHAKKAMVQVMLKEKMLNITVEDDGDGFDTTLLQHAAGIGYKNTQSRVSFLKGTLDIQSKKGEGTSVYIEIPLQA